MTSLAADLPVGRHARRVWLVIAYCVPAVLAWIVLGMLLNLVSLTRAALILIVAYGLYYGLVEATGRPGLPPPGRTWQVPERWVRDGPQWRRTVVWGSLLGPGLVTRNPYAGFGLLILAVASVGDLRDGVALSAVLGFLHGLGRAVALLRAVRDAASADYMQSIIESMRWRAIDGAALLAVTGLAMTTLASRP